MTETQENGAKDAEKQLISEEIITLQCQLEGLFRQCYQGCTQHIFGSNYNYYRPFIFSINKLFEDMTNAVDRYRVIAKEENPTLT